MYLAYSHQSGIACGLKAKSMRKIAARRPVFHFDGSSIICVPAGGRPRAGRVSVRYRAAAGEFVDTTLDRVSPEHVVAGRPVREFRSYKGRRHYSGWYWSATTRTLLAYESRLELARIMLADFDPDVSGIATQPFQLAGREHGVLKRHVPDVLLQRRDGSVIVVDVKPEDRLSDPKVSTLFAWTREVVSSRGWAFEVWSGADAHVLANVCFLAGYRRPQIIDGTLSCAVLGAAAEQPTIGAIERALTPMAPASVVRPAVLHLLWSGALTADLSGPLDTDTPIQARGTGDWHE
jgi:hypothetical protein